MATKNNGDGNGNGAARARLLELRVRDVKCLREVEITFDGEIHEIRGDTGQGKTSILASIEGGLRGLDKDMVRKGASSAEIELHLSTATIKRIVSAEGKETLLATDSEGNPIGKAKDFLRTLCGPTAFRPLEWVALGGGDAKGRTERLRQQRRQLLEAIPISLSGEDVRQVVERGLGEDAVELLGQVNLGGIDWNQHAFSVCDSIREACYEFRKLQNALADDAEGRLKSIEKPERVAPKATVAECVEALEKATAAYYQAKAMAGNRDSLAAHCDRLRAEIEAERENIPPRAKLDATERAYQEQTGTLTGEIAELEALLEEKRAALNECQGKLNRCSEIRRAVEAHESRVADLAKLEGELANTGDGVDMDALLEAGKEARARLEARRAQDAIDAAALAANTARTRAQSYDGLVEFFRDTLPKALLAKSELPIEGLGVDENQILINGIPLHQLGTSQQIKIGVLIASRLNPNSAFILVDGAESMGRKDRAALAQVAHEMGLQLILTVVDPDALPGPGVTVMAGGEAVLAN